MDSKVLVIGLGGIGSEIVCKLEKETEYSKKNNVQFAAMDTDVNTLAALKRQGFGGKIITVSDRMTVGEYLEHNKESGRWYLKNEILSWKPVSEGAGQIRAVSRLALELAIKNGKLAPLYKVIRDLHMPSAKENEADNSAFRIIIVSTLAGGTGSGMLLPLAIHLRKYMIDFFKRKDVIIRGIFLMSDCLDMVVESIAERKSLRSNSYAAIKELDAFMKKADGYLDDRYHYVSLEAASDERDTPFLSYNYCYLFSARDKDKNEMYSFKELKEMVVQCVYAQILGPMQELNNSIEDNVLKSTMTAVQNLENAEFNRYCAAGIRVLRYPYYKILDYLAIEKLLNIFGEQWMEIDTAYDTEMARQEKREEEGYYAAEIRRDEFYVSYIDNSGGNSRLVQQIHQEMLTESERKRWEEYLENLDKNIYKLKENLKMTWRQEEALCRNTARTIREQPRERNRMSLNRLGEHWDRLVEKCERERGKISGGVGISFFGLCENGVIPKEHFYHWLINANGLFHMNSVRYFLYCTLYALKERRKRAEEENKELRKKLENVNKLKKKISSRGTIQLPWMYRKFANEICDAYDEYLNVLDEYYENWLKCRIYLVGIENLQKLVDTTEKFYEKFTDNIKIYRQKKENIQHLLTDIEGHVLRYVGVGEDYLERLSKAVADYDRDKKTNSALSGTIFRKIWELSGQDDDHLDQKINDIFQSDCIVFWKRNLQENYAQELDLNIVEAILQEGLQRRGIQGRYGYLEHMLEGMWRRTTPNLQIESTGNLEQVKNFCTYHSDINSENNKVNRILSRMLFQNGGVDGNGEVDRYTLIFYKVVYNLRAMDISDLKSGNWDDEKNIRRYFGYDILPENAGKTFSDYYETVNRQKITKLTPHIDKNWSNILKMPDLNPSFTERRERQIYQAFWWMWMHGYISEEKMEQGQIRYSYVVNNKRNSARTYKELLQILSENEMDIIEVLQELVKIVEKDCSVGKDYEESDFGAVLEKKSNAIFSLPCVYLCEQRIPQWDYRVLNGMLKAIWDMLEIIMKQFYSQEEWGFYFEKLIEEGYEVLRSYGNNEAVLNRSHEWRNAVKACRSGLKDICRKKGNNALLLKM